MGRNAFPASPGPPRILILESGRGDGGSTHFLVDFLSHLDRRIIEPFVGFYVPNAGASASELGRLGVPVTFFRDSAHRTPQMKTPSAAKRPGVPGSFAALWRAGLLTAELPLAVRIARFITRKGINLVMFNQDIHYHLPALLAARLSRVPSVCRKAGGIGEARRMKRFITPWVDLFVTISEATDADQRNTPGTKRQLMIYRGVDLERFSCAPSKQAMRKNLRLPEGKKIVATISRIVRGKGHPEFLQMAAEVIKQNPNVIFLIVGDQGADEDDVMTELREMVCSLKLDEAVVLTGWRDDIPSILAAVDVFVHCPTTFIEGLCVANLEAMAMAIPTVVSDNGGLPDAVLNGVTGFVVPPGDINAMTSAVASLLSNDKLCREMGANARRRIEQVFDISQTVRKMERVLVECARAGARSARHELSSAQIGAAQGYGH